MTLVDTSVWIDLFAGRPTPGVAALETMIARREDLCLCGVVLAEVLQGIRDEREHDETLSALSDLVYLPMERATFVLASRIYRTLRRAGVTIRSSVDCMIAAACIENGVALLHNDKDFTKIAAHFPLRIAGRKER